MAWLKRPWVVRFRAIFAFLLLSLVPRNAGHSHGLLSLAIDLPRRGLKLYQVRPLGILHLKRKKLNRATLSFLHL